MSTTTESGLSIPASAKSRAYQAYVLVVLLTANIFNYADRSILSVLANDIKRDLGLSDAQVGFLYGTNFAILNAVMCIAMGKLTDNWLRDRLLSIGVAVWSGFTALSGLAQSYFMLALARAGVGIGESTISPVGHSLIAEVFPERRRGISFALYQAGPFMGSALCLGLGGWIVGAWPEHCGAVGLCGIKGWQAAFLVFGLPGLVLAVLVWLMGEPATGAELQRRRTSHPVREGFRELSVLIPPFTMIQLGRLHGRRTLAINLAVGAGLTATAAILIAVTGDRIQWIGAAFAAYALTSWVQALVHEDKHISRLTVKSPVFLAVTIAAAITGTLTASINFWTVPFALRHLQLTPAEAGAALGQAIGIGGFIGTIGGGLANDWWRLRDKAAGIWILLIAQVGTSAMLFVTLRMTTLSSYALALGVTTTMCLIWPPGIAALVQDVVRPHMRGRATSFFVITIVIVSMCLGPYTVGCIADITGSLQSGLELMLVATAVSIVFMIFAGRRLPQAYALRDSTPTLQ
jgi:MFS family permease